MDDGLWETDSTLNESWQVTSGPARENGTIKMRAIYVHIYACQDENTAMTMRIFHSRVPSVFESRGPGLGTVYLNPNADVTMKVLL